MIDAEAQEYVQAARDRTQLQLALRYRPGLQGAGPAAAEAEAAAWTRLREQVLGTVAACDGLRLMRETKARRELAVTGAAGAWRRFLADNRALVAEAELEVRRHYPEWPGGGLSPWHR